MHLQLRRFLFLMGFGFIWGYGAYPSPIDYKPLSVEVREKDRIVVRGIDGDLRFIPTKRPSMSIKVKQINPDQWPSQLNQSLDEWNFSVQKNEDRIEISVQSPLSKPVWREVLRSGSAPRFLLEIESPVVPVDVAWRSGKVRFDQWGANLKLTLQEGSVSVLGGLGDLKIIGQDTEIQVKDRQGQVRLESYSGRIVAENLKGGLEVENFLGDTRILGSDGPLEMKSYKGQITVTEGKGRMDFEIERATLKVLSFTGDFKGTASQGAVSARLVGGGDVRIKTNEGPVVLELPNSGAYVHIQSMEGPIQGPSYLRAEPLAGGRLLRGRLKGAQEGSVVVKTQSGAIRIR